MSGNIYKWIDREVDYYKTYYGADEQLIKKLLAEALDYIDSDIFSDMMDTLLEENGYQFNEALLEDDECSVDDFFHQAFLNDNEEGLIHEIAVKSGRKTFNPKILKVLGLIAVPATMLFVAIKLICKDQ
jgi:hypothetical protein